MALELYTLREDDFDRIIELGGSVHGANYLDHQNLEKIYRRSCSQGLCCSYTVYEGFREQKQLVGFRLTYAPGTWEIDKWCSADDWGVPPEKVCYFKSNTVAKEYQGRGIGTHLLDLSIGTAWRLGAVAGVTHIWMESPGNSAYRYFTKAGGQTLWVWPSRWNEDCTNDGYDCIRCGTDCHCTATEMILYFGEQG